MHQTLAKLIDLLDSPAISGANVIRWGSPVPVFGDLASSYVATLGINPSNREFVDELGRELEGTSRRFHTLGSLGLPSWSGADARHLRVILDSFQSYFRSNPYRWFRILDQVLAGANVSYYGTVRKACHLDLIPYATAGKWTELSARQRSSLLDLAGDTLGYLLRDSPVRVLILNGSSVVRTFERVANIRLEKRAMPSWSLSRRSRSEVAGFAYKGLAECVAGIEVGRKILVLGFNHNLQSSFGVTASVVRRIRDWISRVVNSGFAA